MPAVGGERGVGVVREEVLFHLPGDHLLAHDLGLAPEVGEGPFGWVGCGGSALLDMEGLE